MTTPCIDADFPGGNIVLERVDGDDVFLRQDRRDTTIWWFYWYFRVTGAGGRRLAFHFTDGDVVGARGPAVSQDGGESWAWLGVDTQQQAGFEYTFAPECDEARFCFAVPYLADDLSRLVDGLGDTPHLRIGTLCTSRQGRRVELIRAGRLDGDCAHKVLLTCRHHCCEMMASYVLEGILQGVLGAGEEGRWLRQNVELCAIPFVDKDGVQDGDQGKNRAPRDHNRDYEGDSIYPETEAIRRLAPSWSGGKLGLALDLHCPYIKGGRNETAYFVGLPQPGQWVALTRFSELLEQTREGDIPYRAEDNLPFGLEWNTSENFGAGKSFAGWAFEQPGVELAATLEVPYANARGVAMTAPSARALGRDLARVICEFLR